MKRYTNEVWEPYFSKISPFLSRWYFKSSNGLMRNFLAGLIFAKLTRMEKKCEQT